jgi:hypothetical protein
MVTSRHRHALGRTQWRVVPDTEQAPGSPGGQPPFAAARPEPLVAPGGGGNDGAPLPRPLGQAPTPRRQASELLLQWLQHESSEGETRPQGAQAPQRQSREPRLQRGPSSSLEGLGAAVERSRSWQEQQQQQPPPQQQQQPQGSAELSTASAAAAVAMAAAAAAQAAAAAATSAAEAAKQISARDAAPGVAGTASASRRGSGVLPLLDEPGSAKGARREAATAAESSLPASAAAAGATGAAAPARGRGVAYEVSTLTGDMR